MSAKIAARYRRDRVAIAEALGTDPGRLVAVEPGWGDPHRGRQTVARVSFASGIRLGYKPRSVAPELLWRAAVTAVERGLGLGLVAPRALDRGTHGWVEWVRGDRAPACPRRYGAVLALLDLLEVRDVHRANVVRAQGQPVLVDAETIGHPRLPGFEATPSVMLTGALPWPPGARDRTIASAAADRRIDGSAERLIAGYRAVHRLFRVNGAAWLRADGVLGRLRHAPVRVVLRPTRVYATALRRGAPLPPPPGVSEPGTIRRILRSEARALARGDIPVLETRLDGTDLHDERGLVAPEFFAESGWQRIVTRVTALGPRDEKGNVTLIRSCLRLAQATARPSARPPARPR